MLVRSERYLQSVHRTLSQCDRTCRLFSHIEENARSARHPLVANSILMSPLIDVAHPLTLTVLLVYIVLFDGRCNYPQPAKSVFEGTIIKVPGADSCAREQMPIDYDLFFFNLHSPFVGQCSIELLISQRRCADPFRSCKWGVNVWRYSIRIAPSVCGNDSYL